MLEEVLSNFDPNQKFSRDFTVHQIIKALFEHESGKKAIIALGQTEQTFNKHIKRLFPGVKLSGRQTWKAYLLDKYSSSKKCTTCQQYKPKKDFGRNISRYDELNNKCLSCDKARTAERKAGISNRTPKWANESAINDIYANCPDGYEVDHVVPLFGHNVCGLHVESNLQYLPVLDNRKKSNKFNGEDNA